MFIWFHVTGGAIHDTFMHLFYTISHPTSGILLWLGLPGRGDPTSEWISIRASSVLCDVIAWACFCAPLCSPLLLARLGCVISMVCITAYVFIYVHIYGRATLSVYIYICCLSPCICGRLVAQSILGDWTPPNGNSVTHLGKETPWSSGHPSLKDEFVSPVPCRSDLADLRSLV